MVKESVRCRSRGGTTQRLAEIVAAPVSTIAEVVERLTQVYEYALGTTTAGECDGIVCFTQLYRTITQTVDKTEYEDRDFLVRLDVEFAGRYFDALRRYAQDRDDTPNPWRLLFDARSHPDIERVQFAAAGVNAHINYDLAAALLATWEDFPPNDARFRDYRKVDGVFQHHMDHLREVFGAPFGGADDDGGLLDALCNRVGSALVRTCRSAAWDDALKAWEQTDRDAARAELLDELDAEAGFLGRALLLRLP